MHNIILIFSSKYRGYRPKLTVQRERERPTSQARRTGLHLLSRYSPGGVEYASPCQIMSRVVQSSRIRTYVRTYTYV